MFAIIDVEATGGNPKKDKLMEIAIFIHNGKRVIEQFCTLINPEVPIQNPYVINLTGITDDMVKEAPTFKEVSDKIRILTEGCVIVGHNVRFDYTFLHNEYKWMGETYIRKTIDTIALARKLMPGLTHYGLAKLCEEIGIAHSHKHRAFGDAAATAELFDMLLKSNKDSVMQAAVEDGVAATTLPPYIDRELVAGLPEDVGVYYFKNEKGQILYVGKSNNIRNRVISHFSADMTSGKHRYLKNKIHHIDYILTGSELIALILESTEIKRFMPEFNVAEKRKKFKYGIYSKMDASEAINLSVKLLTLEEPLAKFTQKNHAVQTLMKIGEQYHLCSKKLGYDKSKGPCQLHLQGFCEGICIGTMEVEQYNKKVENAIQKYYYLYNNFLIFTDGRQPNEKGFILIENAKYIGFGYIDQEMVKENTPDTLKSLIENKRDLHHQDIQRIIQSFLKKNPRKVKLKVY